MVGQSNSNSAVIFNVDDTNNKVASPMHMPNEKDLHNLKEKVVTFMDTAA